MSVLWMLWRPGREVERNARKLERSGTEEVEPRRELGGPDIDLVWHVRRLGRSDTVFLGITGSWGDFEGVRRSRRKLGRG